MPPAQGHPQGPFETVFAGIIRDYVFMWFLPSFLRFPGGAVTRITESSHRRLHVALGPMGRTHRRIVDRVLLTCVGHVSSCVDVGVLRWGAKASALCIAINASFSGPVGGLTKRYTTCSNIS